MFFERHITQVIERQKKRKSTVIMTGPRQIGKSTLLKHILPDVKYVTLDDPMLRLFAKENAEAFLAENKAPVIIDEIQKAPELLEYVKMIVDENNQQPAQYFFTGSHMLTLIKKIGETMGARAGIMKMLGLSKRELNGISYTKPFKPTKEHIDAVRENKVKFDYNEIVKIIHRGSFPALHNTKDEPDMEDWKDYYSAYLQTYIEKDVKDEVKIENHAAFIKFMKGAASLSGEQLNVAALASLCGMNVGTVNSWLSLLEKSGHIFIMQPYYNNPNKRLVKTPKIYFLDTGFICYLGGWNTPQQLTSGAKWGHVFESYIVSEILKSYFNNGDILPSIYYYRDKEKNEIDVIIEEGDTLYPVEIKTTTAPTKSMASTFTVLSKIPGKVVAEGAIVCLYKDVIKLDENIWVISPDMI